MSIAVETFDLTKVYSKLVAVDRLNIKVPEKCVFGFLGPNGAGKTTTVKMLVGLTPPTEGTATIMGWDIKRDMENVRNVVGFLPEYFPKPKEKALSYLVTLASFNSARDMRSLKKQAEELLELVGLWDVRNKKVSKFSMGMFKRWLLANALMGDPEVVFLDEPTANLDPIGRAEILELIRNLSKERTIFLNSHILHEVEKVADHVAIINKGRLIVQTKITELKNIVKVEKHSYVISSDNNEKLASLLKEAGIDAKVTELGVEASTTDPKKLWTNLVEAYNEANIFVYELKELGRELEDIFLKLVEGDQA
ncbi:MAG: ABC transporter ATP-binding protein [Candidatus Jordarchaeales archaeon]